MKTRVLAVFATLVSILAMSSKPASAIIVGTGLTENQEITVDFTSGVPQNFAFSVSSGTDYLNISAPPNGYTISVTNYNFSGPTTTLGPFSTAQSLTYSGIDLFVTITLNSLVAQDPPINIELTTSPGFTAAVPEPSTWAMMILGFCGLGFMGYRKRRSTSFA